LTSLQRLDLANTAVTRAGVTRLKASRPDLTVVRPG